MDNNSIIMIDEDVLESKGIMTESDKTHFGTYYGCNSYMPINENDLWEAFHFFLKELTYAIQTMLKRHSIGITDDYFKQRPKEYYIDRYELESFTEEKLLKLWRAIEDLIEFKYSLKVNGKAREIYARAT